MYGGGGGSVPHKKRSLKVGPSEKTGKLSGGHAIFKLCFLNAHYLLIGNREKIVRYSRGQGSMLTPGELGPALPSYLCSPLSLITLLFARVCSQLRTSLLREVGFCPRVPVHKNRYKRPNNVQQLNKGS